MYELLVLADDRTGALESAGSLADSGLSVEMRPLVPVSSSAGGECLVVDLGSRHLTPQEAGVMVGLAFDAYASAAPLLRHAHKIDSTLRGNWAAELVTRERYFGQRVLIVAAFPAAGRTCVGGVVLEHGVPVAEGAAGRDPLSPVTWSRPAEHLRDAGAEVVELGSLEQVGTWLAREASGFAVCDASTDAELEAIAAVWTRYPDVVLAGTAAAIAAIGPHLSGQARTSVAALPSDTAVLVVCGSAHLAARAQLVELERAGWPSRAAAGVSPTRLVLATPALALGARGHEQAVHELADAARAALGTARFDVVMVIGGETAAALLGPAPMTMLGTMAPGVACGRPLDDPDGPLIITKPGGFGGPRVVVELLGGRMGP